VDHNSSHSETVVRLTFTGQLTQPVRQSREGTCARILACGKTPNPVEYTIEEECR